MRHVIYKAGKAAHAAYMEADHGTREEYLSLEAYLQCYDDDDGPTRAMAKETPTDRTDVVIVTDYLNTLATALSKTP